MKLRIVYWYTSPVESDFDCEMSGTYEGETPEECLAKFREETGDTGRVLSIRTEK